MYNELRIYKERVQITMKKFNLVASLVALLALTACEGKGVEYAEFHEKANEQQTAINADLADGKLPFKSVTIKGSSKEHAEMMGMSEDTDVKVEKTLTFEGESASDWASISKWNGYAELSDDEKVIFSSYTFAHMADLPDYNEYFKNYESYDGVKTSGQGFNYYVSNGFKVTADLKIKGDYSDSEGTGSIDIVVKGSYVAGKDGFLTKVNVKSNMSITATGTLAGIEMTTTMVENSEEALTISRK